MSGAGVTTGDRVSSDQYPVLYDRSNVALGVIKDAYNCVVTDELLSQDGTAGQEVLDFNLPHGSDNRSLLQNELIVQVGGSAFEIRTVTDGWDDGDNVPITTVHAEALWYALGDADVIVDATAITTAVAAIKKAISQPTSGLGVNGWTAGTVQPTTGSITFTDAVNPLAALRLIQQAFGGDLTFDNVAKKVHLYTQQGSATPVAMYARGRNLAGNQVIADTTDLVTRLYPYGADDATGAPLDITTVNPSHLAYIENYTYYDALGIARAVRSQSVQNEQITDASTLLAWGTAQLDSMATPAMSYTITQTNTGEGDAAPGLGDVVRVHDDSLDIDVMARIELRTRNILQPQLTTYNVDTALFTLSDALQAVDTSGSVDNSTGGLDFTIPDAPSSVTIVTGVATAQGAPAVQATAEWAAVTENTDTTPYVDLGYYEVQWSFNSSAWADMHIPPDITTALVGVFPMGGDLVVRVRAVDSHGNLGEFTTSTGETLVADTDAPPPPSAPIIDTATAPSVMRVTWDGKDDSGQFMTVTAPDLLRVEVYTSDTNDFSTATLADTGPAGPFTSDLFLGYGVLTFVWLVAVDTSLNASDPSAVADGTIRQLVDTDAITDFVTARLMGPNVVAQANIQDAAVGTAEIIDGSIVNAKIGTLAVNDANIATVNVGKITAGTLAADITVSARIKTANTGARVELNSSGLQAFNSGGTQVALLSSADGSLTVTGPIISAGSITGATVTGGTIIGSTYETSTGLGVGNTVVGVQIAPSSFGDRILFYSGIPIETGAGHVSTGAVTDGTGLLRATIEIATAALTGGSDSAITMYSADGLHFNGLIVIQPGSNVSGGLSGWTQIGNTYTVGDLGANDGLIGAAASTVGMHYHSTASSSFHYFEDVSGAGVYCPVKGGVYTDASSAHLKKNIKSMAKTGAVETIKGIRPVHYRLKQKSMKDDHLGFIAEELKEVLPHAVWEPGADEPEGASLSVSIVPVVATLVKAFQEHLAECEGHKA